MQRAPPTTVTRWVTLNTSRCGYRGLVTFGLNPARAAVDEPAPTAAMSPAAMATTASVLGACRGVICLPFSSAAKGMDVGKGLEGVPGDPDRQVPGASNSRPRPAP